MLWVLVDGGMGTCLPSVVFFGNSPCRVGPVSRHSVRDAGFDKASGGPHVAVSRGTRRADVS